MTASVNTALNAVTPSSDGIEYALLRLPTRGHMVAAGVLAEFGFPFSLVIHARDEVTLVLPREAVEDFRRRLVDVQDFGRTFRLITFDGDIDPTVVGFMAAISTALAAAGVFIIPIGAFTRDHLLVYSEQLDLAMETLRALQQRAG